MVDANSTPIFIMSSERSGSNLLRSLLSNHAHLAAPVAPQFLPLFHNLVPYYGTLVERENAYRLLQDMLEVVNHPYYNWGLTLNVEEVYTQYQPNFFLDFFTLFYTEKQKCESKYRFVCKANRIFDFAFALNQYFKDAKFIYLYRDARDYAVSIMKIPSGPNTPFASALHWNREQEKCNVLEKTFHLPVYYVRYEDLVADTPQIMTGLLNFLEEPIDENCFQVQTEKNKDVTWNIAWQNLSKPIMTANFGKYRQTLSASEINMIETIARNQLLRLGYRFDSNVDWKESRFFRYQNFLLSRINRRKINHTSHKTTELLQSRDALVGTIAKKRKREWEGRFNAV